MAGKRYRWQIKESSEFYKQLVSDSQINVITAKLLANRGLTKKEDAIAFIKREEGIFSSPYDFENMDVAVARIKDAIHSGEHIIIYGDFDVDGVTGTALLYKTFNSLGANFSYYIPDRTSEGHGLNTAAVCKLISSRKAKVIITTDCASSNFTEISLAKSLGVDVIITDHHELSEILPPAIAVLNTKLLPETSPMKVLAGVGVAYKFAEALLESYHKTDLLEELLCLVSIGTIADLASLTRENRLLVSQGLNNIFKFKPKAIYKLLDKAKYNLEELITAEKVGFGIGPRLNAVGRLSHAEKAVQFLISEDDTELELLATEIELLNAKRKEIMEETYLEALRLVNLEISFETDRIIVLASSNWHPGIIGVVASRLVDKFYLPVCMIAIDEENNKADASCRSIEGINIFSLLEENKDLFTRHGGHSGAGGFSASIDKIPQIKHALKASVVKQITDPAILDPTLKIDMELDLANVNLELTECIETLAPFGMENPSPLFSVSNVSILEHRFLGDNKNHLKLILKNSNGNIEALAWNTPHLTFDPNKKVDIVFSSEVNSYGNSRKVQMIIADIKQSAIYKGEDQVTDVKTDLSEKALNSDIIMLIDHRNKSDKQHYIKSLVKAMNEGVAIFAEHYETLQELSVSCPIIDRYNKQQFNQVIFWELPPSSSILKGVISNAQATTAHIISGKNFVNQYPGDFIKPLILMLKYAINHKNGEVTVADLSIKLATTKECAVHAIMLLHKSGIINIIKNQGGSIHIEWGATPVKSSLSEILKELARYNQEYHTFNKHLNEVTQYRSQLQTFQIKELRSLLTNA